MTEIDDLEVGTNNLFRNGRLLVFPAEGESLLVREKLKLLGTLEDRYHTLIVGDELFKLAYRYYSDTVADSSKYWWVIADANNIYDPFDLSEYVGKDLLIPDILNVLLVL